jgi:hypothetical protein
VPRRLEAEKRWSQALVDGTWQDAFWTREFSPDPRCLVLEETREAHGSTWRGLMGAPFVDESEALAFLRFACVPGMLHEITGGTGPVEAEPVKPNETVVGVCARHSQREGQGFDSPADHP